MLLYPAPDNREYT